MAKPLAIQLYTVREACAADFPGTLKTIADIGYKGVEFAGLHGMAAREVKALIDDLGLQVAASHGPLVTTENINQVVDTELTLGNRRLVSGRGPDDFKTADACARTAEMFAQAAELLAPHGIDLGYHNHWWEFTSIDGKWGYDLMFEQTSPKVFAEIDVYWVATGKADPAGIVKQFGKRAPLLHIKDGPAVQGEPHTAVGSGTLDMPAIIGAGTAAEWLIVELDACATDMMEAVRQSYRYLTSEDLASGNK